MRKFVAISMFLGACAGNPSPPALEEGPGKQPAQSVCDQAVDNLIRIGAFLMAEVDPPSEDDRSRFCQAFEQKGYDLQCVARAPHIVAVAECKYKCPPDGDGCK